MTRKTHAIAGYKSKLLSAFAAGLLFVITAAPAFAALRLRIEVDPSIGIGPGVVITDNGPGDTFLQAGAISFSGVLNSDFTVNVTVGQSKPFLGGPGLAELDLFSLISNFEEPGTLRIILEDDGYAGFPPGSLPLHAIVNAVLTAPTGSSITLNSYANEANLVPILGPDTSPAGALVPVVGLPPPGSVPAFGLAGVTFGPGFFAADGIASFAGPGPFSLFSVVSVTFTGQGSVIFGDHQEVLVPEPTSAVMLSMGLISLALAYRRKRQ